MVTVPRPPPTAEQQRKYDKNREALLGIIPDPEAAMERAVAEPFRPTTDKGVPHSGWEDWPYPLRKNGTRKEGKYRRHVRREPGTNRFAKRFNATEFARTQNLPTGSRP